MPFSSTSRAATAAVIGQPLWFIEGMAEYLRARIR